jgi:hypothetical protein
MPIGRSAPSDGGLPAVVLATELRCESVEATALDRAVVTDPDRARTAAKISTIRQPSMSRNGWRLRSSDENTCG